MKYIVSETKLLNLANVAQPDVVRHRNKNLDPASVPGKAKAKEFKRINAFYQTPKIGLN